MKSEDFKPCMDRLILRYGQAYYPEEVVKLIYTEAATIPAEAFSQIVTKFISESRAAPLLPEIREQTSRARGRIWEEKKRQPLPAFAPQSFACGTCFGTGDVLARSEWNGCLYAFKCSCGHGRASRKNFPEWASARGDNWKVCG